MQILDIPFVSELAHVDVFGFDSTGFFFSDIMSDEFSELFDFEFVEFKLTLLFLKNEEFFFLLEFFLRVLSVDGFDFFLPEFLGLPSLLF